MIRITEKIDGEFFIPRLGDIVVSVKDSNNKNCSIIFRLITDNLFDEIYVREPTNVPIVGVYEPYVESNSEYIDVTYATIEDRTIFRNTEGQEALHGFATHYYVDEDVLLCIDHRGHLRELYDIPDGKIVFVYKNIFRVI